MTLVCNLHLVLKCKTGGVVGMTMFKGPYWGFRISRKFRKRWGINITLGYLNSAPEHHFGLWFGSSAQQMLFFCLLDKNAKTMPRQCLYPQCCWLWFCFFSIKKEGINIKRNVLDLKKIFHNFCLLWFIYSL